jgi:hypothetical protein
MHFIGTLFCALLLSFPAQQQQQQQPTIVSYSFLFIFPHSAIV